MGGGDAIRKLSETMTAKRLKEEQMRRRNNDSGGK
jgi:hypothetical protein